MKTAKTFNLTAILPTLSLLLITGCASKTVSLKLHFTDRSPATYRVVTESSRNIEFEGPMVSKLETQGGLTARRVELTFAEQVQGINDEDNAIVKITIKDLKYLNQVKNNIIADFDSRDTKQQSSAFAKLIGQSYTIELSPAGKVQKVTGTGSIRYVIQADLPGHREAIKLIDKEAIEQRHSIPALMEVSKKRLLTGDSWSSTKSFSFGLMGAKSYEKVYKLKEIAQTDSGRIAIVEMNAIPSSQQAEQLHEEQSTSLFSQIFDNVQSYTGRLALNLTTGKIDKYIEELDLQWVVADPASEQTDTDEPNIIKMTARYLHSIEKLN